MAEAKTRRGIAALGLAVLLVLGAGCELLVGVDRDKIDANGGGGAAGSGTGGLTGGTGAGGLTAGGGTGGTGGAPCVPVDDGNECTDDVCEANLPVHVDKPVGSPCQSGGSQCDGNGACVACLGPADCPGEDTACRTRTCEAGACGFDDAPLGTPLPAQTAGDCKVVVCDGAGAAVTAVEDSDVPDDSNPCTDDICAAGEPSNPPSDSGSPCGGGGATLVCDGAGSCIGCVAPTDCLGSDNECKHRTCENQVCGIAFTAANTPVAVQIAGNCLKQVCNGTGVLAQVADDTDVPSDDGNACTDDACAQGSPIHPAKPTGAGCDDGNACTQTDTCKYGSCTGGNPKSCPASDPCHDAGACDPATGLCGSPMKPNGAPCDDGDACTQTDACAAGVCTGGNPKTCTASDACHDAGSCDPATGACSNPVKADGASCDDGDLCTQTDACAAGVCTGSDPKTCTASDACHDAGTCDPATGACDSPNKADGVACDDGDLCTQADACVAGVCTGSDPKTCTPVDTCHDAGVCNPASGVCSTPVRPNGSACDDQNGCTLVDTCSGGICVGSSPKTCAASDMCHTAGTCNPASGACSNPAKPDGSACTYQGVAAVCSAGFCVICGNGTVQPGEECDDGNAQNGDGCDNDCTLSCGNGVLSPGEPCDDGDRISDDGCSAKCQIEAGYSCSGAPSYCTSTVEVNCNDGVDNDADGLTDCADTDCAAGCNAALAPCGAGESLLVYTATDLPVAIPDSNILGVPSHVTVPSYGVLRRVVVQADVTHTFDADIDMLLTAPWGATVDLTSDNGAAGANYTNTLFADACATKVTSGTAPFNGCYGPEAALTTVSGVSAKGVWTLNVDDDLTGDTGTFNAFRLVLCVTPGMCSDGAVDAGEACDDGNAVSGDGCDGNCTLTACGNGLLTTGEVCDDGNLVSGDGCDSNCTVTACGNGVVSAGETCDDANLLGGDGCGANCATETGYVCVGYTNRCGPVCGDGAITATETCDDGNTLSGDACDAACATQTSLTEIEPNDTVAGAETQATAGVLFNGTSAIVGGGITSSPTQDKDIYKFVLATAGVVRMEVFDSSGSDCKSANIAAAMKLSLLDSAGALIVADTSTLGIGYCPALVRNMNAGTYYLQVEKTTTGAIAAYKLEVKVQSTAGSEVEANNTSATSTGFPGSDVYIFGSHQLTSDIDVYAIPVPAGKSIRAEIIEGSGAETCESNGIASRLYLDSAGGSSLANDSTTGRGNCSLIDGTGASPVKTAAHNLAAGTYYLRVQAASQGCATDVCKFDYRLVVTVR
ncbi:MAG: DUF4215 domain-containing protein [Polyangiaceae bacterium]